MKHATLRLVALLAAMAVASLAKAQSADLLEFVDGSFRSIVEKTAPVSPQFTAEGGWPSDHNGRDNVALVQVKLEHIPVADALRLNFRNVGANATVCRERDTAFVREGILNIFVPAVKGIILEAQLDDQTTQRYPLGNSLKHRGYYGITLRGNRTATVRFTSEPEGAEVWVDGDRVGTTPIDVPHLRFGSHLVRWAAAGLPLVERTVEVSDREFNFDADLRLKKTIRFSSNPSGAAVIVDGDGRDGYVTPCDIPLTYQPHSIRMQLDGNRVEVFDIIVDEYQSAVYPTVNLVPKKEVTFRATFQGRNVEASLDVDNHNIGRGRSSYSTALTHGTHDVRMSYQGYSATQRLRVGTTTGMQVIDIKKRRERVWPWMREYDTDPLGLSISYVQKQWAVRQGGEMRLLSPAWNAEDEVMRGIQAGVFYEPALWFGLGIYTGIFYEFYYAKAASDQVFQKTFSTEEYGEVVNAYDFFNEHSFYVPLHAYYRIPLGRKVALKLHGGLGMDCGIFASFSNRDEYEVEPIEKYYGEDSYSAPGGVYPKRLNFSAEAAGSLRFWNLMLNFQYSWGLTDHQLFDGAESSKMNKMAIGLSYVFGND